MIWHLHVQYARDGAEVVSVNLVMNVNHFRVYVLI